MPVGDFFIFGQNAPHTRGVFYYLFIIYKERCEIVVVMTNVNAPEYAIAEPQYRVDVNEYPSAMQPIPQSRMFTIKDALQKYKDKVGKDTPTYDASQGDGGASLPGVSREILDRAHEIQIEHGTGYDKPFGTDLFRKVATENYWKIESQSGWDYTNIAFTQGGRDGLLKAYSAMIALGHRHIGDLLVVSRVPWISYNWGPYSVGLNVLRAPGDPNEGWKYTPESIRACAEFARHDGRNVAGLVITSPDNPTGRTITLEEQIELAQTAIEAGYPFVLFDWIYHWVTDGSPNNINVVLQAFNAKDREKLIFLDGITKSLGASNIRSAHLLAGADVIKHVTSISSHGVVPSFYAQAVAIAAYENDFAQAAQPILEPIRHSRNVLRTELTNIGFDFIMGDGYYAFINLTPYIEKGDFEDSAELGTYLGEEFGVAVVPGVYFSPAGKNWVRFSYALPPKKTEKAFTQLLVGLNSL